MNLNGLTMLALAVGKERLGGDALTLVQLLANVQRKFLIVKYEKPAKLSKKILQTRTILKRNT